MRDVTYAKSTDWSYEREWRVASFKEDHETGHYSDVPFHTADLCGIYFGPFLNEEERTSICEAVRGYPNAKLFQVSVGLAQRLEIAPYV
jgi:hypothetical protein